MVEFLLPFLAIPQQQEPIVPILRPGKDGRGRDPWVFRCIFEDRTRMVLVAFGDDLWMAFNPETGGVHKVWRGDVEFRGKVWDFSQENSRARGRVMFEAPSEITRMDASWYFDGTQPERDGFRFKTDDAHVSSPKIDTTGWQRMFLAFDETGRKGRFRVDLEGNGVRRQWFESATHVESETGWQWNFKRVEFTSPSTIIKISQQKAEHNKALRNVRLYGDRPVWFSGSGKPLPVQFLGYELVKQTKGVVIRFRLSVLNQAVTCEFRPERTAKGWTEDWRMIGLKTGLVSLRREGSWVGVSPSRAAVDFTLQKPHRKLSF